VWIKLGGSWNKKEGKEMRLKRNENTKKNDLSKANIEITTI
jgi:hypothetical protein